MVIQPAIEVRDEDGILLGLANERHLPPREKILDWVVPITSTPPVVVLSQMVVPHTTFEYVHLRWDRYRVGQCVYWCVMVPRRYWPRLLKSSRWLHETGAESNPFHPYPVWANLPPWVSAQCYAPFLQAASAFSRRAA